MSADAADRESAPRLVSWSLPMSQKTYGDVADAGYDIVKTETLRTFDGQQGFTLAQGR
jgi:hypothetical protein